MKNISKIKMVKKVLVITLIGSFILSMHSCLDIPDVAVGTLQEAAATDTLGSLDVAERMLLQAQYHVVSYQEHKYQYQRNLHIDNYSGYFACPHSFDGRLTSTYVHNVDFSTGPLAEFQRLSRQVVPVMASASRFKAPELKAIATILFCYGAQEYADVHGPMPYTDMKMLKNEGVITYEPLDQVYASILNDLSDAIDTLKKVSSSPTKEQLSRLQKIDKIAGQKFENWVKLANTLRLRMALHMVKVDAGKAQEIAEAAVASGVLEYTDNDIELNIENEQRPNPLYVCHFLWVDSRLSASMENILKRLKSPLLEAVFERNHDIDLYDKNGKLALPVNSEFIGVRTGIELRPQSFDKDYLLFSRFNDAFAPMSIMKVSESLFLRAEGALRGWNMGGTTEMLYNSGIRKSLETRYLDYAYDDYIALKKAEPIDYVDYYNQSNNIKGSVTIGVAWDDADSREIKLEKIITQKWLGIFPMGMEAWTEYRRTGYPKLFPAVSDEGDGSIDLNIGIRRIPFVRESKMGVDEADVDRTAVPALGGPDEQGTRLWWDIAIGNF